MLIPAFQLSLNNPILHGLVTVGKYDGEHPSLTCATNAGKIFIHSPHERDQHSSQEIRFLNINRRITALASGMLDPNLGRDILLVGAQTTLLAYDVEENSDMFYKDVPDGVNAMVVGRINSLEVPLAVLGGNCSIQGFDFEGNELFWTVTGDNVSALTFCDVDDDGQNELLVGSEDFEIRVFQNEEVIAETTETDRVVALTPIKKTRYGYALGNGTVGIYDRSQRIWRVKSKHEVTAIAGFDLDGDGLPELISGWSNGKLEVRSDRTGEIVYKDHFPSPLSAIVRADYRKDGREELICCALDGEVRGYLPVDAEMGQSLMNTSVEEETLRELHQKKQELLYELKNYEDNLKRFKAGVTEAGLIPTTTQVNMKLQVSQQDGCVYLTAETNNDTRVKAVIVFADQIFEGESHMVHERDPSSTVRVPLRPKKDVSVDMAIKVLVGSRSGCQFHVFDLNKRLPKFIMYVPCEERGVQEPASSVTFTVRERVNRVVMWLNSSFNINYNGANDLLDTGFVSLRGGKPLWIKMTPENGGQVTIKTDDMEVAGEVVQDLCAYLQVEELESVADFPYEMEAFRNVLLKVDEYNAIRLKLTAEMADSSNLVKTLVIKAEDARILGDMKSMRSMYSTLYNLNAELIGEYAKRANNHEKLLEALKEVNHMIQKAARLRVGVAKTRVVAACRNAIKSNNIHSLFKIIKTGNVQ